MIPCSKKLRRAAAGNTYPDWASLVPDLVEEVGWRVLAGDLLDYVWFRAACSRWSASTVRPRGRGILDARFHPCRWMMLPEGHGLYPGHPHLHGFARFFNLATGAFVRVHLPLLDDHVILDSVDGLLLLLRDHDTAVRLLHPFTGDIAELPPLVSLLPHVPHHRLYSDDRGRRSFLMNPYASVSVTSSGTVTVMLAFLLLYRVAYATSGDQQWAISSWTLQPLLKPMHSNGKLYVMQYLFQNVNKVHIYQIDPPHTTVDGLAHLPLPVKIAECPMDRFRHTYNLAECGSELFLVAANDASGTKLSAYRLADLVSGRFVPVTSIGDYALFLGERCVCVSLSLNKGSGRWLSSISPNSVICLHAFPSHPNNNSGQQGHFGQYNLGTGMWTPASDGNIAETPPPSPHMLIHHIFTCFYRKYWNKGLMYCRETEHNWLIKQDVRFAA